MVLCPECRSGTTTPGREIKKPWTKRARKRLSNLLFNSEEETKTILCDKCKETSTVEEDY